MALRQWHSRALAFCRCACSIDRAARPASRFAADWPNPNPSTNAPAAVRTWHTVRPAFFPPKLPADLRQHQVAHRTDDLVPLQPQIAPTFPVVKAQFRLGVLKACSTCHRVNPTKSRRSVGDSVAALLTKYLIVSRFNTLRAASHSSLNPGKSFSSLSTSVTRLASQTSGPLSVSLMW